MEIHDACSAHLTGITAIYNDAVLHSTAIWNERIVDRADRAAWLSQRQEDGHPVLVALGEDGAVLGYAACGSFRGFDGFRRTVEHSVYVRSDQQGRGVGRALMVALIQRARTLDVHVMVAGIEAGNIGSIRLHESLGFQAVGVLPQVGAKFGRWLDLAFLQLQLDHDAVPMT